MALAEGNRPDLKQMAARIIDLLEPDLVTDGFDLLDVRIFQGGGRHQLRIYVDMQEGSISMDQVASASRTVSMLLEEADPFPGQYVIEVSSPGIRRPLRKPEHYLAAVGHRVDLKISGKDSRHVRGVLQEIDGEMLIVATEGEEGPIDVRVETSKVQEGNLDPEFDAQALINADRRKRKEEKRTRRQGRKKTRKGRPKAGKDAASKAEEESSTGDNE
jgi:ribosome maturation factor RimP